MERGPELLRSSPSSAALFIHRRGNGFLRDWVHENLVVNNGRAGIRYENVGEVADPGEALIDNNEVHGNSTDALRGGVTIVDAQNALVRNNVFGAATIAGVTYSSNSESVAIRATDSGRSDRPDLLNVDIMANVLNGELIMGCELPDDIVYCQDTTAPTVGSVAPADGAATDVALDANVEASFSQGHGQDLAGNPLAADKVWSFTTLTPPPTDTTMYDAFVPRLEARALLA
jgi:hypothetical protein